jgi:rhodanese-related sulfurtransferase
MADTNHSTTEPVADDASHVPVLDPPAASPSEARDHFERLLRFETDCWDVHESLASGDAAFVLLDVRQPTAFAHSHVPGAVNLPYRQISAVALTNVSADATFVVYCNGPHCNGADRAAARIASLGRPVKKMIGGIDGWKAEGFDLAPDGNHG